MRLLTDWSIARDGVERKIELLCGDLTKLPPQHAVDVLIVSAFQNDYAPTPGSLIGALDRAGVSVANLAKDKHVDLRQQYSCWMSKRIDMKLNIGQILCVESGWQGAANEITDDIFRALAPYLLAEFQNSSVAMPLVGAGDQGHDPTEMLQIILLTAVNWIERGLPLELIKIVISREDDAQNLADVFSACRAAWEKDKKSAAPMSDSFLYDIFLSYSHVDHAIADFFVESMDELSGDLRIFRDNNSLSPGSTWLMEIAQALDSSRCVVALYSPSYWTSKNCQLEFLAAFTRQHEIGKNILYPIYLSEVKIPYMFTNMQYIDCRSNNLVKIANACRQLSRTLQSI